MSTYAVFGMTRHRAKMKALKDLDEKFHETEAEWLARVDAETDAIMASKKCIQLSEKFDSPSPAKQFMVIAKRSEHRDLHVKAWVKTGDKLKSGKDKMHWITP